MLCHSTSQIVCFISPGSKKDVHQLQHHRSLFSEPALSTEALSPEELEVLELIGVGKTSGRIAQDLGISFQSTVGHRMRIMQRSEERRVGKEGRSRWSPYH